ncbi:MAG: hypothetical protein IIB56_07990 [Planctomycetes bacterium]|nr:hypothetical protein [Planctomycetota bacterium]
MSGQNNKIKINIFTIGFAGKSDCEFFTKLKDAGVKRVIDVRLNNVSQLAKKCLLTISMGGGLMTKIIVEKSIAGKWWLAWLSYKHRKMAKVSYFDSGSYVLRKEKGKS